MLVECNCIREERGYSVAGVVKSVFASLVPEGFIHNIEPRGGIVICGFAEMMTRGQMLPGRLQFYRQIAVGNAVLQERVPSGRRERRPNSGKAPQKSTPEPQS
jgi:hypothetical protein